MSFLTPGENFFHYTTREAAFGHILPSRRLRLSRYHEMRDPLEYKEWWLPATFSELEFDETQVLWEAFKDGLAQRRGGSFLLSLSIDAPEDPDREPFFRGWSRGRMWEQYAENHAGVCLVFDRRSLSTTFAEAFDEPTTDVLYRQPVNYEEPPARDLKINLDQLARSDLRRSLDQFVHGHYQDLFFTKTMDWQAEHEYRFVVIPADAKDPPLVDFGDSLKAVIVGERFPEWQAPGALRACESANALPARIFWHTGRPQVLPFLDAASHNERETP